jgi:hypothetical protein
MKTRFAIALAIAGITFYGGAAATVWAATFSDDFSSGLRPVYWSVAQTTAGLWSVDDTQGDVRLAKAGMSPGGLQNVRMQLDMAAVGGPITGDFSEQIDFSNAVVGPSTDQIELHVYFQDGTIFFLVYQTGPNVHVWDGAEHGTIAVTGNSGTFMISRTGSMLSAYYNGTLIYSETNTSPATAMEFVNQLQPGSDDNTSVTFDNFSLTAATVPIACTPPPPNMISWWPGDGNANDIQGSNNGTLMNGATFAPGLVGQAFSFDGINQYVDIANAAGLNPTTALTFDAWVNPQALANADNTVIAKSSESVGQRSYGMWITNDGRVHVEPSSLGTSMADTPPGVVPLNTWTHVAGVITAGVGFNIYVNGVEQSLTTAGPLPALLATTVPVMIGDSDLVTRDWLFTGLIDEVEIFNRALSQAEIQAIVNAGSFGKCKGQPTPTPTPTATSTATPRGGRATPTPRPRPTPLPRPTS